jgi:acyl-CoA thioesterase I
MKVWSFPPMRLLAAALATVAGAAPAWAGPRPAPVVTLLGDSITAGYGLPAAAALPAQLQAALGRLGVSATVRGAGVSGDTSAAGLARVDFSVQPDTALCVVELGGNDYLQSVSPAATKADLTALVRRLKARRIAVLLAGGTVPTRTAGGYATSFNAIFPAIARAEHVALEPDFLAGVEADPRLKQSDGIHPNAAGVRIIAARLAPAVAKALAARR